MFQVEFDSQDNPAVSLKQPAQQRVPYIFNSPHSGRIYPASLKTRSDLTSHQLRRSEDCFVEQLFAGVVTLGAPLLSANFPRAWLDVNREPYELDPKLFGDALPGHANANSLRVNAGLGTIPRLVAENMPIYRELPTLNEALYRIETVYRPYHVRLRRLMADTASRFGYAVLVDCHSMPSNGTRNDKDSRADIIVGDRYGTSCDGSITRELISRFSDLGYQAARNKPYAGGFITEHYGRPLKGLHAVQIEINRDLYMNENTLLKTSGFDGLANDINKVLAQLISIPDGGFGPIVEAAE